MSYFGGNNNDSSSDSDKEIEDDDSSIGVEEQELGEEGGDAEMEGGDGEEEDIEVDDDDEEGDDTEYVDEGEGEGEEGEGEGEDEDEEGEEGEDDDENKQKKSKKIPIKNIYKKPDDYINDNNEDEDDDENSEQYLQKFDQTINENYVLNYHPETVLHNYDEISAMTNVTRNSDGIIIDKLHRTIPYLTKYEKARILGQRAKQINAGAYPLVKVPENVIDGLIIAELELKQKRIPFIIRRPLPNGGSEYWKVKDLEDISF
jgi:DNA-directed RNA polymerase I, II, and III subunit RPABC2